MDAMQAHPLTLCPLPQAATTFWKQDCSYALELGHADWLEDGKADKAKALGGCCSSVPEECLNGIVDQPSDRLLSKVPRPR